ncbi:ABC transporter ATP-binding protein [Acaricomes phytoseiuli]|uniref:dipeptide ABC transporter ATP-binding protein n=1 Tax=Acaricomes phytoseiuli TaxID=291968 RepID=UPI00037ABC73|nr:ABC transporter ATP-binding protein [Acaricomes phytoseiuli]MCW1250540.1 ABC transporter ATP-binding protein [Acaricomes phytoseiuli]
MTAAETVTRTQQPEAVLSVRDLRVSFNTENGINQAVRGVDFDLYRGKTLGIVGESGSGKSVSSLAIMGLLPETADITGSVLYRGRELLGLSDRQMSRYRGNELAMVFQDPLSSLTPVLTVGDQIIEALTVHNPGMNRAAKRSRAVELLDLVGIPSPQERLKAFPHEFSGGMRQRVMIAIAIANNPDVLFADECTTALDVTIQAQILDVLKAAQRETGAAVVMITHDLGVVAGIADEIMVMYAGQPVERATAESLFRAPRMPYTLGLLGAIPRVDTVARHSLVPIKGTPPNLTDPPPGCSFAARCPIATDECRHGEIPMLQVDPQHEAACLKTEQLRDADSARDIYPVPEIETSELVAVPRSERQVVLQVQDLVKHHPLMKGALFKRRVGTVKAADGLSFDIREGECFSIVGESGCGKTTTLLEIMEFDADQVGTVRIGDTENHGITKAEVRSKVRKDVQMVFQDPTGALDPRFTVFETLSEPLEGRGLSKSQIRERVLELMELVGLQPDFVNRFPNQFSGGQRQRIGIARALATNPKLIVLDEPVSALDVSVQAGVINLLEQLRVELGLSYLLVSHDLSVVRHISDRVAVMYLGKIVEIGQVDQVFDNPQHPYTRALLSAIPIPDPVAERSRERIVLKGDLPTPLNTPEGCVFRSRCPIYVMLPEAKQEQCRAEMPPLFDAGPDHRQACLFPEEELDVAVLAG